MTSFEYLLQRCSSIPLAERLSSLEADLDHLGDIARHEAKSAEVGGLLHDSRMWIECAAPELNPDQAAELVDLQRLLTRWLDLWPEAQRATGYRLLLELEARHWRDRVRTISGASARLAAPAP